MGIFNPNLYQMRFNMEDFRQNKGNGSLEDEKNAANENYKSSLFKKGTKLFYKSFFVNKERENRTDIMSPNVGLSKDNARLMKNAMTLKLSMMDTIVEKEKKPSESTTAMFINK